MLIGEFLLWLLCRVNDKYFIYIYCIYLLSIYTLGPLFGLAKSIYLDTSCNYFYCKRTTQSKAASMIN